MGYLVLVCSKFSFIISHKTTSIINMNTTTMKKEVPSKEYVYDQLRGIRMSDEAQSVILCILNSAGFEFCIIVKQLTEALSMPKAIVERALKELIDMNLVKQQALFGSERTYILNRQYFMVQRPERRTKDELKSMLKVITNPMGK